MNHLSDGAVVAIAMVAFSCGFLIGSVILPFRRR